MSFRERAERVALAAAAVLRAEARAIGVVRSVDATESAKWLDDMADQIVIAAGHPELTRLSERLAARGATVPARPPGSPPLPEHQAKSSGALGTPDRDTTCEECGGAGKVLNWFGLACSERRCPFCAGKGGLATPRRVHGGAQ